MALRTGTIFGRYLRYIGSLFQVLGPTMHSKKRVCIVAERANGTTKFMLNPAGVDTSRRYRCLSVRFGARESAKQARTVIVGRLGLLTDRTNQHAAIVIDYIAYHISRDSRRRALIPSPFNVGVHVSDACTSDYM